VIAVVLARPRLLVAVTLLALIVLLGVGPVQRRSE
jgi:hypothetical protein